MKTKLKSYLKDKTIKSAIINLAIKPVSIILSIVYTPLLLNYLGDEKYGIWATMLSIISWINYCDIGIGNGLRNILTKELTDKQYENAKKAISTAYICLTVIMSIVLVVLVIATFLVDWKVVFGTRYNARIPVLISVVFICINFVLSLSNNVLYALQKSEITSIKSVCIQIINIIGLLVLTRFTSSSLVYMSILFGASSFIAHGLNSLDLLKKYPQIMTLKPEYDKTYVKKINSLGLKFFVAQIAALVLYTTDNLLVSSMYGAASVTPFSIADKVYNTGYLVFSAITVPFWSKTTQEMERENFDIIQKYYRMLNILAVIFAIACIAVAFIFRPVVTLWLGREVNFSNQLIIVMCLYYAIYGFCGVSAPFINGMNGVNGVMLLGIIQGIANIPLSIIFARNCNMGITGIRLGTLVVVLFGAVFQDRYFSYLIKKGKASIKKED